MRSVSRANTHLVIAKRHIHAPMQSILWPPPVRSDSIITNVCKPGQRSGYGGHWGYSKTYNDAPDRGLFDALEERMRPRWRPRQAVVVKPSIAAASEGWFPLAASR